MGKDIWIILSIAALLKYGWCGAVHEMQLIRDLLKNYDPDARPVKNQSDVVKVELQMIYKELKEIIEPKQQMTSLTRFRIKWKDASLQWNKSKYAGVETIHLHAKRIWKPDLTLYNSVHENGGNIYRYLTKTSISSDGTVTWLTYAMLKTTCKLEITAFPVDDQICTMKIGSWTLSSTQLDLELAPETPQPNLEQYSAHTEWQLISATAAKNAAKYPCCADIYTDITYTLHFRRKPWFYIITIVFPCIILSLLASISFLFPAGSGERVSLVISVLLGLTVFMLIINEETPVTSDSTPMLTKYFSAICCATFIILLLTALILQIHHAPLSTPVPYYMASTRDFIAFLFCIQRLQNNSKGRNIAKTALLEEDQKLSFSCKDLQYTASEHPGAENMFLTRLRRVEMRLEEDELVKDVQTEWQYTARVFDRLFLFIFLLFFTALNIYIISFLQV